LFRLKCFCTVKQNCLLSAYFLTFFENHMTVFYFTSFNFLSRFFAALSQLIRRSFLLSFLGSFALLAACGGGGDTASAPGPANPANATQVLSIEPSFVQADDNRVVALAADTWVNVATEGQLFNVSGTQTVRYGIGTQWIVAQLSGTVQCSNSFFKRDPAYGIVKQCEVSTGQAAGPPTPAPLPSTPVATPGAENTCGIANFSQQALALVNQFRSQSRSCGSAGNFAAVPALTWNDQLTNAAFGHSKDMADNNYFSHESLDQRSFIDRLNAAGYRPNGAGENIAAGQPTLDAVMQSWQNSPGHCANLMIANHKNMGLACMQRPGSLYGKYWTMELAAPK
jgi:uncharacterized protein YkwD